MQFKNGSFRKRKNLPSTNSSVINQGRQREKWKMAKENFVEDKRKTNQKSGKMKNL